MPYLDPDVNKPPGNEGTSGADHGFDHDIIGIIDPTVIPIPSPSSEAS
jgi:hypothetical protein